MKDYRIKISDGQQTSTYIVRNRGVVRYINGSEQQLALSFLVGANAAEFRFALEDARDGAAAVKQLRAMLKLKRVEVLQ